MFISVGLTGCGVKVYSDFDHDINFARYKTFRWAAKDTAAIHNQPNYYSALSDRLIRQEVERQLMAKEYTFSEGSADARINYHFVIESWATAVSPDPFGYTYDSYWLNREIHLSEYRAGTLIIDLMDPETDLLLWRGWVINFKSNRRPKPMKRQIVKATGKLFARFPLRKM
jgi:hypothetical protein